MRDDVIEECNKHGGVLHLFVDKASPQGNIYVKCPSIAAAVASVNSLHGRYFAGRLAVSGLNRVFFGVAIQASGDSTFTCPDLFSLVRIIFSKTFYPILYATYLILHLFLYWAYVYM